VISITPDQVRAGQALYSKPFLAVYNWAALGFYCRFVWRCRSRNIQQLYDQHVSANHLDIGVGTGFFLERCRFPELNPRLALMDLNPNSLEVAGRRLARYSPEIYKRNVLEPIEFDGPRFDTVAVINLLHCLPGTMETKGVVFEHVKPLVNPGGKIFGSTILYQGIKHNPAADLTLEVLNRLRTMTNKQDSLDTLKHHLERSFPESHVWTCGYEALFWARVGLPDRHNRYG